MKYLVSYSIEEFELLDYEHNISPFNVKKEEELELNSDKNLTFDIMKLILTKYLENKIWIKNLEIKNIIKV